jgi:hypothetical protein
MFGYHTLGFGSGGLPLLPGSVMVVSTDANNQFMLVESLGSFATFGDLVSGPAVGESEGAGAANFTRGVFASGSSASNGAGLGYINMRTQGSAKFFGAVVSRQGGGSGSNTGGNGSAGSCTSTTRFAWAGQTNSASFPPGTWNSNIDYIDYASLGTAQNFGELTPFGRIVGGAGSSTRGIYWGRFGNVHGPARNDIDFITIASTGNSSSFGDSQNSRGGGAFSSTTRCVGNQQTSSGYVTIASTGNAQTFSSLRSTESRQSGSSQTVGIIRDSNSDMQKATIATTGSMTTFGSGGQSDGGNMACNVSGGNT